MNPAEYPYEVELEIFVGSNGKLDIEKAFKFSFGDGNIIQIEDQHVSPREEHSGIQRVRLTLLAFSSASVAENAGKRFMFSVLWFAASKRISIRFQTLVGEYPFRIRDRNKGRGSEVRGEGRAYRAFKPEEMQSICLTAFQGDKAIPNELLISMEIYATTGFESSERAKFISIITALEALCIQGDLGDQVDQFITAAKELPQYQSLFSDNIQLRSSFASRLSGLKRESVRQAILKKLRDSGFQEGTIKQIDEAYGIRSQILHEGFLARNLGEKAMLVEDSVRKIYSTMAGIELDV